jgi:hypothetical protein
MMLNPFVNGGPIVGKVQASQAAPKAAATKKPAISPTEQFVSLLDRLHLEQIHEQIDQVDREIAANEEQYLAPLRTKRQMLMRTEWILCWVVLVKSGAHKSLQAVLTATGGAAASAEQVEDPGETADAAKTRQALYDGILGVLVRGPATLVKLENLVGGTENDEMATALGELALAGKVIRKDGTWRLVGR